MILKWGHTDMESLFKRSRQYLTKFSNTTKFCHNLSLPFVFSIAFSMFENVVKYGILCLIYYNNQSTALSKPQLFAFSCFTELYLLSSFPILFLSICSKISTHVINCIFFTSALHSLSL